MAHRTRYMRGFKVDERGGRVRRSTLRSHFNKGAYKHHEYENEKYVLRISHAIKGAKKFSSDGVRIAAI